MTRRVRILALTIALAVGCGSAGPGHDHQPAAAPAPPAAPPPATDDGPGTVIAAEPQRAGDPARGWDVLVHGGYVGCGVPRRLFDRFAGTTADAWRLPGRTGAGADLPYALNAYTAASGRELVTANCLGCHAGWLRGQLVVGLGDASADFTGDTAPLAMAGVFITDEADRAEWARFVGRFQAIAPSVRTATVGANPADHIAAALFAHRDPRTLAWSDAPTLPLPTEPTPVDVPAWWLLKKKAAMFHTGAGRGDQSRIMMTASVLCVDDVAAARAIDADFPDLRAFVLGLEPPPFPAPIDGPRAAAGAAVFARRCARCHGTYGPGGAYRTRVIPAAEVGTDPVLARRTGQFAAPYVAWFNGSFYGQIARLEPGDGYVAPPLDGVWATAPYFHNGSVPTLAAVLDSGRRAPRTAIVRGADDYDLDAVGWRTPPIEPGRDETRVSDTARPGHGNGGPTYGDRLTAADRAALLEYLKTL